MAPIPSMEVDKSSWDYFPAEIRRSILETLLQDGCSLASFATVSREWQTIIERHNFARIKVTPPRLAGLSRMAHRNRALVRYIWLCIELEEYDCSKCAPSNPSDWEISFDDNVLITGALQDLFRALSTWGPNDGGLVLDISVHSPSDSEHVFKYLTFGPDISSEECSRTQYMMEQAIRAKPDDHDHGWVDSSHASSPNGCAIGKIFEEIMPEEPFCSADLEYYWWRSLPPAPVVTNVLLRQQTRRRWKPMSLAHMFAILPGLQEIYYEPWRAWGTALQDTTDIDYLWLFKTLMPRNLRRLVLFENFDEQYPSQFLYCDPIRVPRNEIGQAVANASLKLEHLSASFIVDASCFFCAREPYWSWPNLKSLILTSQLLTPTEEPTKIDNMLQAAASAAMRMPNLETMEIWNGREGLAALFRYQSLGTRQRAVITWKGTWDFPLQPPVIQAWEDVAAQHGSDGYNVFKKELLDADTVIRSHGDAIHHLEFSQPVIRPISLQQIRIEHNVRKRLEET